MNMMMKGLLMDENLSNLTSTSGEVSASSGTRIEAASNIHPILQQQQSFTSKTQAPPQKKKRSLPGNPDPDAEVIALSPKTLMTTNRFICEICNKGFQRDQNLQLHRRGHNLPWKLKQRSNKEVVRKKVYICPEVSCVHHDPSRALGDLTGIKKHFFRKHGEKKWKCEKCSKRYAVQSDWKAHSKICGTREYRCDCGTLFSRRDSFITHRAFCDALAEESARSITDNNNNDAFLPFANFQPQQISVKREQDQSHLFINQSRPDSTTNMINASLPPWLDLSNCLDQNPMQAAATAAAHMSATALLQKAAQMGATMSSSGAAGTSLSSRDGMGTGVLAAFGDRGTASVSAGNFVEHVAGVSAPTSLLHDVMSSFSSVPGGFESGAPNFDLAFGGMVKRRREGGGGNEGLTRDFLGLKPFPAQRDFANLPGFSHLSSSGFGQQNQPPWQD